VGWKVDVGHGSTARYKMARRALEAVIMPQTLGADMHGYNTPIPEPAGTTETHSDEDHMFAGKVRFSLVSTMTAMLALGMKLEDIVPMVTTGPAAMAGMSDQMGSLKPGMDADITVLNDERGRWVLQDNEGTQAVTDQLLTPAYCLRLGPRYESDAPVLPKFSEEQVSA